MKSRDIRREILQAIDSFSGSRKDSDVTDRQIAATTGLDLEQVRDYLQILEEQGDVKLWRTDASSYHTCTTARGRLFLKDPEFLNSEPSGSAVTVSGNIQNAILNIDSTLTDVSQRIDASTSRDPDTVKELQQLIQQLNETLKQAPEGKTEEAQAIAAAAESFVEAATNEKPNRFTVEITREGLQKAAQNIASVMPIVMNTVPQIIALVQRL